MMKSYLICATLLMGAMALWLWKLLHPEAPPPPRLVQDMVLTPEPGWLPPPPGAIPYSSSVRPPRRSGEELYLLHCATCHGADGSGQSFVASQAGMPEVGNLITTTTTPDERERILADGRGAMPAFESRLNKEARRGILQYITTFSHP